MPKVTIRHVAEAAGVGIGTVSRVINNNDNVSDKTRKIVRDVIEDLGFVPNAAARQLPRKNSSHTIGIITPSFFEYYSFAERLQGVQTALQPYADFIDLAVYNTRSNKNYNERVLSIIESSVMSGLLVIDFNLNMPQKEALHQRGTPFVGSNHIMDADDWVCIGSNNEVGGYKATSYLIQLGHRRIAYLGNELIDSIGSPTSKERYTGYLQALHDADIPQNPDYFRTGDMGSENAKILALDLLRLPERPTAIFAMSDVQALGCLSAARELGLRVPEDISIIGYDDLEMSEHIGLSTIRQHLVLSGEITMNYLLQMIHHDTPDTVPRLPELQVIERRTTAHL
ncbi:MAG: LacI family DNA-binding transcriptional regulator [Phototrophicaceae bacterium]